MDTLFISDLHLCDERPDKLELFKRLLRGPAREARALYILGDLFEHFWLGDQEETPPAREVIAELADFSRHGGKLFILRGNRDLLFGPGIEPMTGGTLLPDQTIITLDNSRVLITHGDMLCTRDVKYQRFRRFVENRLIRRLFFSAPYALRVFIVRGLQPRLKQSVTRKSPEIIDVDPTAVSTTMEAFDTRELIHGHTHRPGFHELQLSSGPARRIVLGDWYEKDSVLVCRDGERKLMRVEDYLKASSPLQGED